MSDWFKRRKASPSICWWTEERKQRQCDTLEKVAIPASVHGESTLEENGPEWQGIYSVTDKPLAISSHTASQVKCLNLFLQLWTQKIGGEAFSSNKSDFLAGWL